jgi:hypothetical protein
MIFIFSDHIGNILDLSFYFLEFGQFMLEFSLIYLFEGFHIVLHLFRV